MLTVNEFLDPMSRYVPLLGKTHQHIYWDQASVLVQLGLLNTGTLPVAGRETAKKILDPVSEPSNELIAQARG